MLLLDLLEFVFVLLDILHAGLRAVVRAGRKLVGGGRRLLGSFRRDANRAEAVKDENYQRLDCYSARRIADCTRSASSSSRSPGSYVSATSSPSVLGTIWT